MDFELPVDLTRFFDHRREYGLHNDLQAESPVAGNFPFAHLTLEFGTQEQKDEFLEPALAGRKRIGFGLTEPGHGGDATWTETTAVREYAGH